MCIQIKILKRFLEEQQNKMLLNVFFFMATKSVQEYSSLQNKEEEN